MTWIWATSEWAPVDCDNCKNGFHLHSNGCPAYIYVYCIINELTFWTQDSTIGFYELTAHWHHYGHAHDLSVWVYEYFHDILIHGTKYILSREEHTILFCVIMYISINNDSMVAVHVAQGWKAEDNLFIHILLIPSWNRYCFFLNSTKFHSKNVSLKTLTLLQTDININLHWFFLIYSYIHSWEAGEENNIILCFLQLKPKYVEHHDAYGSWKHKRCWQMQSLRHHSSN